MSQARYPTITITNMAEKDADTDAFRVAMDGVDTLSEFLSMIAALLSAVMDEDDDPAMVFASLAHVFLAASSGFKTKQFINPFLGPDGPKFEA